jgi:N-acetylmuramoyl-L-alanine amidase
MVAIPSTDKAQKPYHGIWTNARRLAHKGRVIEILFALFAAFLAGPAVAGALETAALNQDELTLTFAAPVGEAEVVALDGPQRIAIDVAGGEPGSVAITPTPSITRLRQGRIAGGALRIVLDLERPTIVTALEQSDDGLSIRVTLADASASDFVEAVRAGRRSFAAAFSGAPTMALARREARRYQVSVPIGVARTGIALPRVYGPANASLPLVVIDAGHGGHDPGAISADGRHHEEQVTLAIARAIRDELVASGRVRVALTRDRDEYLVLEERYGIARRLGADLFLSIHADAAENRSASGASIYTLSEVASDREAARLAARENRANILNGVDLGGRSNDVRSILIDLTQRETMNLSADFARTLQRTAGSDIPFRTASHRFAGFVVLKAPDMPSILLETGFISNPTDAERIASTAGRGAIARGIRQAVLTHFARRGERQNADAATGEASAAR